MLPDCFAKFKTFSLPDAPGIAQLSMIDIKHFDDDIALWICAIVPERHRSAPLYFFNRLFVPDSYRGTGVAASLMRHVVKWADKDKVLILSMVNSYGSRKGPPLMELVAFYERFGFTRHPHDNGILLRRFSE